MFFPQRPWMDSARSGRQMGGIACFRIGDVLNRADEEVLQRANASISSCMLRL
jgi:hypothetical protein